MNTLDWACGLVWRIHQTGKVLGLRELVIGAGHWAALILGWRDETEKSAHHH
jgi:hypothetical protein